MTPGPRELFVTHAASEKAQRGRIFIIILIAVGLAMLLSRQPMLGALPGSAWALCVLLGAFALSWWSGISARAHAMLRLGRIRREGLVATQKLNAGDVAGAREAFAALLFIDRPLGAFHAVHVLMYGVTRFFEGEAKEGLALASRAIDSGWLDQKHTRSVRDAAETWRVLMLLAAGELAEARRRVDGASKDALLTAAIAVSAHEGMWAAVLAEADRALADPQFPKSGRPSIAAMALFAAKKQGMSGAPYRKILEVEKPGPLTLQNPALRKFL